MRVWRRLRAGWGAIFGRARVESELDAELRFHIEAHVEDLMRARLSREEALRQARVKLGGLERTKEECRDALGVSLAESVIQDVRFGLRMLGKNPGFTAVAVITLALGIGANTAIFSMVNGIMLRALSYRQPEQLYVVNENVPQLSGQSPWGSWFPVNAGNFLLWQGECPAVSSMALIRPATFNLTGHGIPRQVNAVRVSSEFFPMLGIRPQLGRAFLREEDELGRDNEVILTAQFWRQVFNSNPQIIGKPIVLNDTSYTVVGIAPESFRFPEIAQPGMENYTPELFKPMGLRKWELPAGIGNFNFTVIARLKPGASLSQALAQIDVVEARIAQRGDTSRHVAPGEYDLRAVLRPLKTVILGPAQRALWMLMAAAGFVLLIICVNLANLILVRNIGRTHEVGLRSAVGASKRRLVRQFFVEGLILAAVGGALGLLFAIGALQLLVRNAPLSIPRVGEIQIDTRVLLFTLGVTIATVLLFALLPALRLAKVRPFEALRTGGWTASGTPQSAWLRNGLVISQIALCGVLLAGALLLIESLRHVARANQWMDQQHVLAFDLAIPPNEIPTVQEANRLFSGMATQVRMLPGVQDAGFTSMLPLLGQSFADGIDFREAPQLRGKPQIGEFRFISPGYFQAIGMPLVDGRLLSENDRDKDVALISEGVAQKLLPGRNPIGMHLLWDQGPPKPREIIGVVADVRLASDASPVMAIYLPLWTFYQPSETLVVRTAIGPKAAADSIRRAIWGVDPEVAIPRERTLENVVLSSEGARRYETFVGAIFATFAVLLAALGLYGVISYSVSQRTHEIGIRVALGAKPRDVVSLVMWKGVWLAALGTAIGVAAALALTRLMTGLLYGVTATDPITFGGVVVILLSVALGATYIPARRAMRVDPMVALRHE